jgi:hypothetical protein
VLHDPLLRWNEFGQALEGTLLHHPHRPRLPTGDRGYFIRVEAGDDAQQDDLRLGRWQSGETVKGLSGFNPGKRFTGIGPIDQLLERDWPGAPTSSDSAHIDEPPTRDREQPAAEGALVSFETTQTAGHVEPDLRGEVLALVGFLRAQKPHERRMQLSVKHGQRPVGAVLCCREHGFEERALRHPVGPFLTGTRLDFAKNRRRGWDSNPRDASRRLAVFKTGSILRPYAPSRTLGARVRAIWGIEPALSSLRPLAHFEPYRCESALRGASRLGGGAPWRKQICHRLATWQATAAEDLTGRWLLPERGLFRSLRKS